MDARWAPEQDLAPAQASALAQDSTMDTIQTPTTVHPVFAP